MKMDALMQTSVIPAPSTPNFSGNRKVGILVKCSTSPGHGALPTASGNGSYPEKVKGNSLKKSVKRVFFLDVNPLCYRGSTPSLHAFAEWLSMFFAQVSLTDPVIAVIDGEGGSNYRRQLLASYKAHRQKYTRLLSTAHKFHNRLNTWKSYPPPLVMDLLHECHVPVVRLPGFEADDVVATLSGQVLDKGLRVVIASPDKDFKQFVSETLQIVMPMAELGRWSFYTVKHYVEQYGCEPSCDVSLRSIIGDEADGVPGIQSLVPAFGRKTALKLIKKHGSLENLLNVAATQTVGKPYAQDALTRHADYLRRNYQVLSLKRDVNVQVKEEWLQERNSSDDLVAITTFFKQLSASSK